jgi:hypothetical protein
LQPGLTPLASAGRLARTLAVMNHAQLVRTAARWRIPRDLALVVLARDLCCIYCGRDFETELSNPRAGLPSWEHIINDESIVTIENIALCCIGCNASKGTRTLGDWLQSKYCQTRGIGPNTIATVAARLLSNVAIPTQHSIGYVPTDGCAELTEPDTPVSSPRQAANDG